MQLTILAIAGVMGAIFLLTGLGTGADRQLQAWRDVVRSRPASGKVVLVEIDARSLASIDRWPWPRSYYARAVQMLDQAGADIIGFDVDVSSTSSEDQDAAFARAIKGSRAPIILPSFQQPSSTASSKMVESLPLASLRVPAMIGAVNIFADPDGMVRSYPYGFELGGTPRPSIGAMLAGASGRINQSFPIDGAIEPATVPHVSFIDLLQGNFAAGQLAGKAVLVGASALELGDRYPVPRHGVIPGALIQLLAAETLLQGTAPIDHGGPIPLLMMLAALPLAGRLSHRKRLYAYAVGGVLMLALPLLLEGFRLGTVRVVPALVGLLAAAVASSLMNALAATRIAHTTDTDTGLPNRRALADAISSMGSATAIVGLRIEAYGEVLGVMGRTSATELMIRVAERVALATASQVYLVEENALAWCSEAKGNEIDHVLDAVLAMVRPGIDLARRRLTLDASLGVADAGPNDTDAIGRALLAARAASASGSRWERYTEELDRERGWHLSLASELTEAMAAGHIWVAYQPKLDLRSNRVTGAEALVRWNHPERGNVSPALFIPALEANNKIYDLTLYVLERALRDMRDWSAAGHAVSVAVNVSALLPSDLRFPQAVERLLAQHQVPAGNLTLEVTESASLNDPELAAAALERLAATGVKLSIDDYGTGQSTLSYLKRLPAREIKIDQSFVREFDGSRSDQAMVRSTIELAHELGFTVVAEGIETEAVLDLLRSFGCDIGQGWLIGRPVPADQFASQISTNVSLAAA